MSSRLSSLLVQDGLVTAKRVADAFQRQVIYGGTLDSNLLELKAVDEDDLIHYLGRADGMPTQPTGINGAGMPLPEVLEVFTREVAERFHAVPTKLLPGGVLRVLVADGVDLSEFDELAQSVQQRIEPWITLEFRFVEAMDKVYGAGTPSRYARLLTRSVQAHQNRDFPPARPIDPLPRFGSLASLRLVPEPPPPPVVTRPVDEPTTLMVAPALSSENTASLQIAAAVADGERTATMAVPTGERAADTTSSLTVPAGSGVAEATATMAVPPQAESTASLAVPPAIEVTASMIVSPETTASLAVPPAIEVTSSMFVPPAGEASASLAVPPAVEATASLAVPPAVEATAKMAVPAATPERATDAPIPAAPQHAVVPAAAVVALPAAKTPARPAAAESVPEFLPTVIIDPNSLNIDRSAPMKLGTTTPSASATSDAAAGASGLDDLSVADWMSAADWLSVANKVDALASARSPIPSGRSPSPVLPAAPPETATAAAVPPVSQPDSKLVDARTETAAPGPSAAAADRPVATTPVPITAAAPVEVPVVEKSVQLTAPVSAPPAKPVETKPIETKPIETKPVETKPQQAASPSRPAAPPQVETGGRKKGKKGKEGKQQGRQAAPTPPPVAEPQRRPQPAVVATSQPPAPQVQTAAVAAPPSAPVQPNAGAAKPVPAQADNTAKTVLPAAPATPSETKAAAPPAAAKSGPGVPVAAASPTAAAPSLVEPPQPSTPPSQPRSTEPVPKPETLPAASAAPSAAAPAKAVAERTPATPAPAPIAPSKSAPERAATPPAAQAAPAKAAPERQSGPSKSAPERTPTTPALGVTAPSKSAPERAPVALPSTQSAPSKSAPVRPTTPAQAAQSTAPIAAGTPAPAGRSASGPSQPAPAATAAPAASATSGRSNLIPEPIPEPVNSGRLGEPILVKDAKPTPPMVVPIAASAPPPASTDSPVPPVSRPPRVATALDAGGFSPISLEAARELAGSLEDRDAVFETLCRGARSRCAFAAVFTLHGEVAFGRVALLDDWLDRTQLGRIAVQLDRPSPFRTAAKERTALVGTIGKEGASSDPLRALNRSVPTSGAVLPVLVRGRAVALLYLDDEGGELTSAVLDELKPLLSDVGQAFLRIAQKNKAGGLGADIELGAIAEELPAVETSAWRAPSGKSPRSPAAAPGDSLTTPLPPSVPAAASPVPQVASEQPTVPLRVSPPAAAPKQPTAAPASPATADAARPAVPDPIHFQPTVPVAAKAPAAATPASSAKSPPGKTDKRGGKPVEAAAPPVAVKEAGGKPTMAELVERASNMDETAIEQLLAGGSEAARAVALALPGPLRSRDRQALGDPVGGPVYSRGPLLALALRMGQQAIEPMLARLDDASTPTEARYYLCLCFAEAPVAAAIGPLATCLYDGDDTVRLAAVTALRNFPPHSDLSAVISKLRDTVDAGDGKRARFAVEALGELRVASAVPQLLNLLDHEDPALVDAVGRALQTITKQDFGRSRVRWTEWWRRSQDEPRLQWLLEGLTHSSAMLRSAAQDELTGLSGDVVGYRFDQPRRDREVARKRWAQWWQRRGYPVL